MHNDILKQFERTRESIERGHADTLKAVNKARAEHVAAASRLRSTIEAGFDELADIAYAQVRQLERMAHAIENPNETKAIECRRHALDHFKAGNFATAREQLEESLRLDARVHATYLTLGFTLAQLGEHDRAVEVLMTSLPYAEPLMKFGSENPRWGSKRRDFRRHGAAFTLHVAARLRAEQGKFAEARDLILRVLSNYSEDHPRHLYYEMASYCARAGDVVGAGAAFKLLLDEDPQLACIAIDDETLANAEPLCRALLDAEAERWRCEFANAFKDAEPRLAALRPKYEAVVRARERFDANAKPGACEAGFASADRRLSELAQHARSEDVLRVANRHSATIARNAVEELEAAAWSEEEKSWKRELRRRQLRKASGYAKLAAVFVIAFAGIRAWNRHEPTPAAASAPAIRGATHEGELGQRLAQIVLELAPAEETDDSVTLLLQAAQVTFLRRIWQDDVRSRAPALGPGFQAYLMTQTSETRYPQLHRYIERAFANITSTKADFLRDWTNEERPLQPSTFQALESYFDWLSVTFADPAFGPEIQQPVVKVLAGMRREVEAARR